MSDIHIVINDDLKDDEWKWEVDVMTEKKNILFVSRNMYRLIDEGKMPKELAEELTEAGSNGGSLL